VEDDEEDESFEEELSGALGADVAAPERL